MRWRRIHASDGTPPPVRAVGPVGRAAGRPSNAAAAHTGVGCGHSSGLAYVAGAAHPAWADNSNSTGTNPDGTLSRLDVYTATVAAP